MPTYGPINLPLNVPGWTDTGIDVPAGTIPFVATGVGTWNGLNDAYPDGSPAHPALPFPIPGQPLAGNLAQTVGLVPFCLCVIVAASPPSPGDLTATQGGAVGVPFNVPSTGGRVYIGFNDIQPGGGDPYADNTGSFDISFTVPDAQEDEEDEMTTRYLDDVATFWTQLVDVTGAATDATGTPTYAIYEELTGTAILTGNLAKQTATGLYSAQVTASAANGFEVGKSYVVRVAATVSAIAQGKIADRFVIRPTIADSVWTATLVADATGNPSTTGGALRRILAKLQNRMTKVGNVVTLYATDNTTAIASSQYSLTDTGFDRPKDS